MATIDEQIKEIEDEIEKTPRNKGTEHHIGKLKAKLAKLTEDKMRAGSKKSGQSAYGYSVKKTGDATAVFVGYPSVGKSTILNNITNAQSKVGSYDFTTLEVIPGVLEYHGARIQILDIPGIVDEASSGKGRGREILSVSRIADLIIIVANPKNIQCVANIKKELHNAGIRLNMTPPDIDIVKKDRGGIIITSTIRKRRMDDAFVKSILNEFSIHNAELTIREDLTPERLIDSLSRNRIYVPMIVAVNKIDTYAGDPKLLEQAVGEKCVFISAQNNINMDTLKKTIFEEIRFLRIYMKQPGKDPDMKEPMILRGRYTTLDIAEKIHKEFAKHFKFARIWGPSAKFGGQKVGANHLVKDTDVVELNFEK